MEIVREVLDKQVLDRKGRKVGKVDGIVLELRDGRAPRLAWAELGSVTLARRFHPRLAAWAVRWAAWWGVTSGRPLRVPWSKLRRSGLDMAIDVDLEDTPAFAVEEWLRRKLIGRIPGA